MSNKIRIKFSEKLLKVLRVMEENDSYLSFDLLWMSDLGSKYFNGLKITNLDIGVPNKASNFHFIATIGKKKHFMKIGKFIRYYFPKLYSSNEISSFVNAFNRIKNGDTVKQAGTKIKLTEFSFNPKDVRSTFLSMVTKTYPYGHEDEVLEFLPNDLKKDKFGNYYKIIGDGGDIMFTAHLDTADRSQNNTNLYTKEEDGDEIIYTDGSTILGADDKAGATIMLYMISHNVTGVYYFFIGEERGGIGSSQVAQEYGSFEYLKNIKKCVSFDRRKTISVITHQLGRRCCSDLFGTSLCNDYNKNGLNLSLDNGGIYTDSASFIDEIVECTNLSVGYNNEHTGRETQNITFLEEISKASVEVNWGELPVGRKVGLNQEIVKKHKDLIDTIKRSVFALEVKMIGFEDKIYIRIDLDGGVKDIYDNLSVIQRLLDKHKVDSMARFNDTYIKIELK